MALGKIKLVQPIEPPSPQPSPARRERGQAAWHGINFCLTTVIPAPAYARTGYDVNLPLNLGNCFSDICFLGFPMDSRLRGNDGGGVFDVVCS